MPSARTSPLGAAVLLAGVSLAGPSARADEGQWPPGQLAELDWSALKKMGLELEAKELWRGDGGLMRAAVNYGGCSGAFVSAEGLIATNHHCAYPAIQAASSVEHDYLRDGFLARTKSDELPAKGRSTLSVLRDIRDVTAEVRGAAEGAKSDGARWHAAEAVKKRLVADCEAQGPDLRCEVVEVALGARFELHEAFELRDVRLVYAPPASIGEYGGEVDNWMWPRHTGDFTLLRAYVAPDGASAEHDAANVPYRPAHHLEVSLDGVRDGSFVAILGYPKRTTRYLPAPEVSRAVEQSLPAVIDLYGEWLQILEEAGRADPAVAIQVAALKKGLANRHKNARGMIAGLERLSLVKTRWAEAEAMTRWVEGPGREALRTLPADLGVLSSESRIAFPRDFLLETLSRAPGMVALSIDLARRAREAKKPDLERDQAYMERNAVKLWKAQETRLRDHHRETEARLLAAVLVRAAALPPQRRIHALEPLATADPAQALERARRLYAASALHTPDRARGLFDAADLDAAAARDPLLALGAALAEDIESAEEARRAREGTMRRLAPRWSELLRAVRGGPIYPDANGTLRLSYAQVTGYAQRDGLYATPRTRLAGAVAKHTGADPFDLPAKVLAKAAAAKESRFADPELGDIPLCFLSSGDTTGGNSGSPVIDGRGRLVGLNFDRVWENIAGDFAYAIDRSRNIIVDVRYMLWLLEEVEGATELIAELGVRPGARSAPPSALALTGEPAASACGCREARGSSSSLSLSLAALACLLFLRCRPRG